MTPAVTDELRRAATLAHAVSSLGLLIMSDDRWLGVVSWHELRLRPGMFQLTPSELRAMVAANRHDDPVRPSWFGEPPHGNVTIRFVEMTDCARHPSGMVWCRVQPNDEIHCLATVLSGDHIRDLLTEPIESAALHEASGTVCVELSPDPDLGTTLVFVRTGALDPWTPAHAECVIDHLAVMTATEELTRPSAPWRSTKRGVGS
jgi:hypothetical protein